MQPIVKFETTLENSLMKSAIYINGELIDEVTNHNACVLLRKRAQAISKALGVSLQRYHLGKRVLLANPHADDDKSSGLPELQSVVPVKYWDAYAEEGTVMTHQLELVDSRKDSGQLYAAIKDAVDSYDAQLSVTLEVNTNPLDGTQQLPCMHVHFNEDAVACSLFKIGTKVLLRTDNSEVTKIEGPNKESYFEISPKYPDNAVS